MHCESDGNIHPVDQLDWSGCQNVIATYQRGSTGSVIRERMPTVTIADFRKAVKQVEATTGFNFSEVQQ
jgi:hypothetical protein